ncbi:hydrolase [Pseudomonas sp. FW306-02-F02-AA]|uniref:Isochorismatase n=1 Tax=Pseudomonas fluorescens TaxID=294 RepID=A0A0N7H0M2_PSEFL|nr:MULTISPECIES: cysteine hydrolase family protein [Pseudomonas]ALI03532.1 isochorismatase [Pseudomonas fluorescens]PMZ03438.1 hydrolase [Pseudomonas sp. FW306-02-F02-AB]PMZ09593.1 hydrolase [Pseudomonas sp. FW306-02-H06C]PMZ15333.1 hydrolase [Pseudomonas sp. FW306-02-F02-AA]PMZ21102.1 hydrolase [Pseudomonas sp. FW306-02-F08-AA]
MSSALLIIDMQVGLFYGPDKPHDGERVLANIRQLIHRAREREVPIYAVRHTGPEGSPIEAGSPFWQLLPELELDANVDTLFDKTRPNCFLGTRLAQQLTNASINHVFIVGMKTQYCIDSTSRAAAEQGLQVTLVADAHTCMDTAALSAKMIIEHHNATLGGAFVKLMNTADARF